MEKKEITFQYFMNLQARFLQFQTVRQGTKNLELLAYRFAPLMREKIESKYVIK